MLKRTIQNKKILKTFNIEFIVIFNVLICSETLNDKILRKSLIYSTQYKETFYLGFVFIFFLDLLSNFIKHKSFKKAIRNIRFIREVNNNCDSNIYLLKRTKNNWKNY